MEWSKYVLNLILEEDRLEPVSMRDDHSSELTSYNELFYDIHKIWIIYYIIITKIREMVYKGHYRDVAVIEYNI